MEAEMRASYTIKMLRTANSAPKGLRGFSDDPQPGMNECRKLLEANGKNIDAAIRAAITDGKGYLTLASWPDDGEVDGLLQTGIDALKIHDPNPLAYGFSWKFHAWLERPIRFWVLKRYEFEADFYHTSDGCNSAWVIVFHGDADPPITLI